MPVARNKKAKRYANPVMNLFKRRICLSYYIRRLWMNILYVYIKMFYFMAVWAEDLMKI